MPSCFFGRRVGAHQREHPVGMVRPGGPDLLAVDDEVVAVAHRRGAQAREVGAGIGFGIALAPDRLAGQHGRQMARLLRLGAEADQDRPDVIDRLPESSGAPARRARRPGSSAAAGAHPCPRCFGQPGAIQPRSKSLRCHHMAASYGGRVGRWRRSRGQRRSIHSRTSWRKASPLVSGFEYWEGDAALGPPRSAA